MAAATLLASPLPAQPAASSVRMRCVGLFLESRMPHSLHSAIRPSSGYGLRRHGLRRFLWALLRYGWLGRGCFCLLLSPTFLEGCDDGGSPRAAQLPFRLRSFQRGRFGPFASDLRPAPLLGFLHASPSGGTECSALPCGSFGCGWFSAVTIQYRSEFGNLSVESGLLREESLNGG
jgi:hypothetical protein